MSIRRFDWIRDEDGNPAAYGAFVIEPTDFAKFGMLMLDGGRFEGKQILSRGFVEEILNPNPLFTAGGLLWWRYPRFSKSVIESEKFAQMQKAGVSEDFLKKLQPLENITYDSNEFYVAALENALGKDWRQQTEQSLSKTGISLRRRIFSEEIIGYYASGFRGNYLLVMPKDKLVAVRVVRNDGDYNWDSDGFNDFLQMASGLTGQTTAAPPVQ